MVETELVCNFVIENNKKRYIMRRIYAFFCALFCAFALFANDVTGFVALEFGGNKTS